MVRHRSLTAGAIAGAFSVSRPAVSRHLRVLREAGLVRDTVYGREREYRLELGPLTELETFLQDLRTPSTWERRIDALETEVYRVRRRREKNTCAQRSAGDAIRAKTKKETA